MEREVATTLPLRVPSETAPGQHHGQCPPRADLQHLGDALAGEHLG